MSTALIFDQIRLPAISQAFRNEVRAFLAEEVARGSFDPTRPHQREHWDDVGFARRVADRGWIGLTWPKRYGGQERSYLDRYVLTEEFRAANAPVRQYFTADRQSGPMLIKYAAESVKEDILPKIVRGEVQFCIGMSEPNSGSDLFAASTKATRTDKGWVLNGSKIWTTNAHSSDYMIGLFRTSAPTKDNRRHGLTSYLVDMKTPGITCHQIAQMNGETEFNEVVFDDALIPHEYLLGNVDDAWKQATSELAYERSGPERFLETFYMLPALLKQTGSDIDNRTAEGIGRLVAQIHTLRRMSVSVAGMLENGREPVTEAAIVKDQGTLWQQELPSSVRRLTAFEATGEDDSRFEDMLHYALQTAPKLTIQGGTTEILRGIIARSLGLR